MTKRSKYNPPTDAKAPMRYQIDSALDSIAKLIERHLAKHSAVGWKVESMPELDGSISFRFRRRGGYVRIDWIEGEGIPIEGVDGALAIRDGVDTIRSEHDLLPTALKTTLKVLVNRANFQFLLWPKKAESLEYLPLRLIELWFQKNVTTFFDFELFDTSFVAEGLSLSFRNKEQRVRFLIGIGLTNAYDEQTLTESYPGIDLEPVAMRGAVMALRYDDTRRPPLNHELEPERLISFALARTFNADAQEAQKKMSKKMRKKAQEKDRLLESILHGDPSQKGYYDIPLESRWRQFMSEQEVAYFLGFRWIGSKGVDTISHSDRACMNMRPTTLKPLIRQFILPYESTTSLEAKSFTTEITSRDVVFSGVEEPLRKVLEDYATTEERGRIVCLRMTCIPHLLGQDITSQSENFEKETGIPLRRFYPDSHFASPSFALRRIFTDQFAELDFNEKPRQGAINLLGFEECKATKELETVLTSLGVEVISNQLPHLNFDTLDAFPKASVNVMKPVDIYEEAYEAVIKPLAREHLSPPAPYGLKRSESWFKAVLKAVNHEEATEAVEQMHRDAIEQLQSKIDRLRQEGMTAAFVVHPGQLSRIWDGRRAIGISFASVLEEFGFRLKAFVYEPEEDRRKRKMIRAIVEDGLTLAGFETLELPLSFVASEQQLNEAFAKLTDTMVFSEYYADARLERFGLPAFSMADFEMGFQGATRTFERLSARVKNRFLSRKKRSLG